MDWSDWRCRSSATHFLFTDPKLKKDKEAGNLGESAKTYLLDVYLEKKYGIVEDILTKEMKKGVLVEDKIIAILGSIDGQEYIKNTERKSNEWIEGEADVVAPIIKDVKAPWDMSTLLPWLLASIPKAYECQIKSYTWLWNREAGEVCWILVDCPDELYLEEQKREYFKSGVIWEEDPIYLAALKKLRRRLIVEDYIPLEERVVRKKVERDEEFIFEIPNKVTKAREFLWEIERLHRKTPQRIVNISDIQLIKIK